MKTLAFENSIFYKMGWSEEDWHRYWFDMYVAGVQNPRPVAPNVLVHFNHIPSDLLVKFMFEENESKEMEV